VQKASCAFPSFPSAQRTGQALVAVESGEHGKLLSSPGCSGAQHIKGSGPGLLTHALLPCSLHWGSSYLPTKMQPCY